MIDISHFEVQELNAQETREIEGGLIVALAVCMFALGMAIGLGIGSGKPG